MATTPHAVIVDPDGLTVVVDITDGSDVRVTAYTTQNGSTPHSFPVTISTPTYFWINRGGTHETFKVSAKLNDVEVGEVDGNVRTILTQLGVPFKVVITLSDLLLSNLIGAGGGGSTAGIPVVRKFSFAYNSANILTGHTVYTPTIGDILLDAWFEVSTAWDGTTPLVDLGAFLAGDNHFGYYAQTGDGFLVDMTTVDNDTSPVSLLGGRLSLSQMIGAAGNNGSQPNAGRTVPGKFTTADPVKVVVTQDGKNNGADPGASQGAAIVYLVTVTPT